MTLDQTLGKYIFMVCFDWFGVQIISFAEVDTRYSKKYILMFLNRFFLEFPLSKFGQKEKRKEKTNSYY